MKKSLLETVDIYEKISLTTLKSFLYVIIGFLIVFLHSSVYGSDDHSKYKMKAGVYENPPKVFINEKGLPDGIFIDILESVAEKEGIQIEYVIADWDELVKKLRSGEINILPDVAYTETRDSMFLLNTMPVLSSWIEVFSTINTQISSLHDLENKKIGVLKGSVQEEYLNGKFRNEFDLKYEIISYNDYSTTVKALKDGDIHVIVASRFFYFSDLCDHDIISTGVLLQFSDLYFAFNKKTCRDIVKMFDRNLAGMKNDIHSDYYKSMRKWFYKDLPTSIPSYLKWILLGAFFILLTVSFFAVLLRIKVRAKTHDLIIKNNELKVAKEKAEESDHLKTIFLQNMSHEIRTPMNGILGFVHLLKNPDLSEEKKSKYLDMISISSKRLLETITNIIEISKIESNLINLHIKTIHLNEMLNYQYHFFKPHAESKNLVFTLTTQLTDAQAVFKSDIYMLECIVINLINNALKFTDEGGIEIGNYLKGNDVVIFVKDTGSGIPVDRQSAIFDRFVQADVKITRPHEGSGLGLAIVKGYTEALGGEVKLKSEQGKGSLFSVFLPMKT
ncbi:MAG: transporter substrate-binding domain-containing protein [Bacteroidota bacterium]